jgi:outer membrane autotransporter protein
VAVPIKRMSGRSRARLRIAALLAGVSLSAVAAHAQDATWLGNTLGNPTDWNTNTNWSNNSPPPPNVVPLGTAIFDAGVSPSPTVTFSEPTTTIQALQFKTGAQQYLFDICGCDEFHITGTGITNFSSFRPVFTVEGLLSFENASTAANARIVNDGGTTVFGTAFGTDTSTAGNAAITNRFASSTFFDALTTAGNATITNRFNGQTVFTDLSNAGSASIVNRFGGTTSFYDSSNAANANITNRFGGVTSFNGTSSAGNATITNNSFGSFGPPFGLGFFDASTAGTATITNNNHGVTVFGIPFGNDTASADHATIINNFGSETDFNARSTAGNATITTNSGAATVFYDFSTGGLARFIVNGSGALDFSFTTGPKSDGQISAGSIEGNGQVFIGPNNTLSVGGNNLSTVFSGVITDNDNCGCNVGPGALVKVGSGTLILSGDNTYTGGTTINGGTLQLGNGGTSGSIVGDVTDNGTLAVNRSDVFTFGGAISGIGGFAQNGTGTTILTANNTYTGPTAVNAGILQAGGANVLAPNSAFTVASGATLNLASFDQTIGSLAGAGSVTLGSGTLTTGNDNTSTIFAGTISGGGNVIKIGGGTFVLSGTNAYTGNTVVNAGTLEVDGTIANSASVTVNAGAKLSGTGTVDPPGVTIISSGGTLAPGNPTNPTGTLTIAGNLAFQSGAFYLIQVTPGSASSTSVVGSASLGGMVQAVLAPGMYLPGSYTILHSAGLNGTTFNGIAANLPANFIAGLSYTPTDVLLNLVPQLGVNAGAIFNLNQQAVANAINGFVNRGGMLPPGFFGLLNLTGGNLANALTLLFGEAATGAQQGAFQLVSEFLSLMLDPFVDGRGGVGGAFAQASPFAPEREALPEDIALAYAKVLRTPVAKAIPFEQRWSVWGGAYGGYNKTSGDPVVVGSHDLTARTAGVAAGLDYRVAPGTVVGFALAGGGTGWSLAQNLGSGGSNAFQAGVYATTRAGPFYLAGALAYTQHWMSTDRFAFAGDRLYASFNAESIGGRAEAGYRIAGTVAAVTPYAAVQAQSFHTPTYSETDYSGGVFGLTYNAHNATDTRSELGARFDKQILLNWNSVLALRGKLAWGHDWITDPSVMPAFQALPGATFIVQGATPAKNSALTSAGAELRLINGVSLLGKFDGEFAAHSQTYAGTGTVRYTW